MAINVQETTKLTEIKLLSFYQVILARDFNLRPQLPLAFRNIWRQNNAILYLIGQKTAVAFVILTLQYLGSHKWICHYAC